MQERRAIVRRNPRDAETSRLNPEADLDEQAAEEQPYDRHVHTLQHALGNATFARLLTSDSRSAPRIQRHPPGEELPNKDDQAAEVGEKQQATPPSATRTPEEAASETTAATTAGKEFAEKQKLTPGAMSLAGAEKILQGSYGGFKKIVPGTIEILKDQAACSAKYDEVCIRDKIPRPDGSEWKAGDTAKDDAAAGVLTQGFAWKGVVYINGTTTLVTATAHEILHNNTESKFRARAGETFNEGVTETLARKALTDAGITVPAVTAYPDQVEITKKLIDLVGLDVVENAYFGDVEGLVTAYEKATSKTWADLVAAAKALDKDKVDEAMKPKTVIWAGDDFDSGSWSDDGEAFA